MKINVTPNIDNARKADGRAGPQKKRYSRRIASTGAQTRGFRQFSSFQL